MMTLKHGLTFRTTLRTSTATRLAAGVVALHGAAHLVGASAAFTAARDGTSVAYLGGALAVNGSSLWIAGSLWATLAAAFIGLGVVMWLDRVPWRGALAAAAVASLGASIIGLWAAWIGIVVNAAIVGFVAASHESG